MGENKTFEFHGTPGQYFVVFIVTMVSAYVPIFGWPFGFNYANTWIADSLTINGRKVKYQAGYGETLKFLLKNILLLIVTFGVYTFWFVPKQYRYILAHVSYADEVPSAATPVTPAAPVAPETPAPPASAEPPAPAAPVMPPDAGAPVVPPVPGSTPPAA